jgi:hypothetical protein
MWRSVIFHCRIDRGVKIRFRHLEIEACAAPGGDEMRTAAILHRGTRSDIVPGVWPGI